jgi:mercuric ion transport protein
MSAQDDAHRGIATEATPGRAFFRGGVLLALAGMAGALAAASCCVVPFALFAVGISGAWIANLTAFGAFQPVAVVVALAALAAGFVQVYRRPRVACETGRCSRPAASRVAKAGLWLATVLVAVVLAWPLIVRLLIEA